MSERIAPAEPLDGREHELDRAWIAVERIRRSIASTIFLGITFVGLLPLTIFAPIPVPVAVGGWILWISLGLLLAFRALVWPAIAWRHIRYAVSPREIRIARGVWWRSVSTVPRTRVQHTDVNQGPVERAFELATLTVYTAGTEFASVSLDGLRHEQATTIRDHLLGSHDDDAV